MLCNNRNEIFKELNEQQKTEMEMIFREAKVNN